MTKHASLQSGFTLIELIVAMIISSFVALVGAAAMSTSLDFYQRNASRSASRENVRAVERTLRHEWATRGISVRSDGSILEFDSLHPVAKQAATDSAVARVRYACEVTSGAGLVLTHRITPLPPNSARQPEQSRQALSEQTQILASHLRICAFSFLGQVPDSAGVLKPRWFTNWDGKTPAPDLMRLALSGVHSDMPPVVYEARLGDRPR